MRKSIINGNGCTCDFCDKDLYPKEAIHITADVLADNTGGRKTIGKCDMCEDCYQDMLKLYMNEPRRRTK